MKRTHRKSIHGKRSKIVVIVSAAAAVLGAAPLAAAPISSSKADAGITSLLSTQSPHGTCAVIVKINGDLSPAQNAQLEALRADITRHLSFIHSLALTLPARNLSRLAALPFVTHLSYDGKVKKCDSFTDTSSGAASARQQYGLTGQGVTVAILDSGIQTGHSDLKTLKATYEPWRILTSRATQTTTMPMGRNPTGITVAMPLMSPASSLATAQPRQARHTPTHIMALPRRQAWSASAYWIKTV